MAKFLLEIPDGLAPVIIGAVTDILGTDGRGWEITEIHGDGDITVDLHPRADAAGR